MAGALAGLVAAGCGGGGGGTGGSTGGTGGATGGAGGTGGTEVPTCQELGSKGFRVYTGLHESAKPEEKWFAGTVTGTVTEVGTGVLPGECGNSSSGQSGAWVILEDANAVSWTACYTGDGASMPLAVGDEVTAEGQLETPDISEVSSALTLRVGGKLALFAFGAFDPGIDWPAEISFADGDLLCVTPPDSGCGGEGYEAVATAGGAEVRLKAGEIATLGGFEVHMGGWYHTLSDGSCDGGTFSHLGFVVPAP